MALMLAHRTGEHAANLGPDPVVVKPIMPGPDGLPGAKILRQVAPSAASLVQIQTGVDHLAHIRRQRLVNRKMWRNCLPLGIRQIAWIAPTVILVAFAMLRRPHGMLLLVHQQRTTGGSGRSLISRSVKQALSNLGGHLILSGRPAESIDFLREAIAIRHSLQQPDVLADSINNLSIALCRTGHLPEAIDLGREVVSI